MSERWWRRRRRFDFWFGDFFEEADMMERTMNDIIRQAFGRLDEKEQLRTRNSGQPRRFLPNNSPCPGVKEEYDPLVDVLIEGANIVIVAELRGMDKDCVDVRATEHAVTISVDSPRCSYHRKLCLPERVDPRSLTSSYKNGVLEVKLRRLIGGKVEVR